MHKDIKIVNLSDLAPKYDALLFDIYGVLIESELPYTKAIDTVNRISQTIPVYFVSNTTKSPKYSAERLCKFGVHTTATNVFTAGKIARKMLKNPTAMLGVDNPVVFYMGPEFKNDILNSLNIQVTTDIDKANLILLSMLVDDESTLDQYNEMFKIAINNNAICLCANPDTIIPFQNSNRYCAGYFAHIYEKMGGKVVYSGKPCKHIFQTVLDSTGLSADSKILMIGDTLETDILGARNIGFDSALVLTGNALRTTTAANVNEQITLLHKEFAEKDIYPQYLLNII